MKTQYNEDYTGVPYLTGASNFHRGNIHTDRYTEFPQTVSVKNDLLISVKGTIGELAYNPYDKAHIARQIMALRDFGLNLEYIQIYIESSIDRLQSQAQSMIPGISRDVLLESLVPIPPEMELSRIIDRIRLIKDLFHNA